MSGELNDRGQSVFYGKVGGAVITGNEDGVKHVAMSLAFALSHLGYTIPPSRLRLARRNWPRPQLRRPYLRRYANRL
ncbi:hypothetical protein ACFP81_14275 [Deinococcus lacus]|uniref:Uncharacterized protein n=2 Tax=Deinococcus lacus TaxID=392561 RepID=A0ABW1YGB0_9DEIO